MSKRYPGVREVKNKNGVSYEISYYPYPKAERKQFRVKAGSKQEASIIRAQYLGRQNNEPLSELSFAEIKERLERKCRTDRNSEKTIKNFMWKFRTLFEQFMPQYYPQVKHMSQINQPILERYNQYIVLDQGRPYGWRDELTKIKSMFRKLVKIGCYDKERCEELLELFERPKAKEKKYKEISLDQKRKFLIHIKEHRPDFYGITFLIMRLGWRREQVISLKRTDIKFNDLKPVQIICRAETTKTKKLHVLENFGSDIADVLTEAYLNSKERGSEWLFPNRRGNKVHSNNYSNYIAAESERILKIKLTPHDFRHIFCTEMKKEGLPERDIMAITGHKDIRSFQIYTHATATGMKKVLDSSKIF